MKAPLRTKRLNRDAATGLHEAVQMPILPGREGEHSRVGAVEVDMLGSVCVVAGNC